MTLFDIKKPENRIRHCHAVGQVMYLYALQVLGWGEEKSREMFFLGILHDQAYAFEPIGKEHAVAAATALPGYKYAGEILHHMDPVSPDCTKEQLLLHYADAVVDGQGRVCTFGDRLCDLGERHGFESDCFKLSEGNIEALKELGFKDVSDTPFAYLARR